MNDFILITGASSGIGAECAIELSKYHNLVLSGRNEKKIFDVLERCDRQDQHKVWIVDLFIGNNLIFNSLDEFLIKEGIKIKSFVHCAGLTKILPFRSFKSQYVNQIFNVNLFSAIEIIRVLVKVNNKDFLKNILLISALWSIRGDKGNSIYAASKGALNSLVFSLAQELAPITRINSILPGAIETEMTRELLKSSIGQSIIKDYPLGIGSIKDVVKLIEFLLSENSQWITGQNIILDGGRSTK